MNFIETRNRQTGMSIYITSVGNRLTESMLATSRPDRLVNRPWCFVAACRVLCAIIQCALDPGKNCKTDFFSFEADPGNGNIKFYIYSNRNRRHNHRAYGYTITVLVALCQYGLIQSLEHTEHTSV